jgi:hypothetical protein
MLTVHMCSMSVERDIRFDLIARLCPNTTGAELRSVATEVWRGLTDSDFILTRSRRLGCLPFVPGGKWRQSETFWTLLKKSFGKERNSPRRRCFLSISSDAV